MGCNMAFYSAFFKAKKLVGKQIDKDLPVQAYHYRKITLRKIRDYDITGQEINAELADFLVSVRVPVLKCRGYKDYEKILLISDSRDSAMKREVRLVLRDALCSVTNGTRRSGAGERAGGLTVECEREEKGCR